MELTNSQACGTAVDLGCAVAMCAADGTVYGVLYRAAFFPAVKPGEHPEPDLRAMYAGATGPVV